MPTRRQREILDYVIGYSGARGYPPSYREIADAMAQVRHSASSPGVPPPIQSRPHLRPVDLLRDADLAFGLAVVKGLANGTRRGVKVLTYLEDLFDGLRDRFWYATARYRNARADRCAETVETTLVGWRGWGIGFDVDGPCLISPIMDMPWPDPLTSADLPPRLIEEASLGGHGHGVYAVRAIDLRTFVYPVVGTVELYGTVVEHEKGWRAEHALVRELWLMPAYKPPGPWFTMLTPALTGKPSTGYTYRRPFPIAPDLIDRLAARYGCEVHDGTPIAHLVMDYERAQEDGHREAEESDEGRTLLGSLQGGATITIRATSFDPDEDDAQP